MDGCIMSNRNTNKLNISYVISLYADYNESTKLYNDNGNWGVPACNRCRFASGCAYFRHEPYNKSSCLRFIWDGSDRIDLILKRIPNDSISNCRYNNFKEGSSEPLHT